MNGVHDLGGMHGFGPVIREQNEPVFHQDWERRLFGIALATMAQRRFNVDEFRRSIERMPPAHYLGTGYYEHWLHGVESLLIEKGLMTRDEVEAAMRTLRESESSAATPGPSRAEEPTPSTRDASRGAGEQQAGSFPQNGAYKLRFDPTFKARFRAGDRVRARNINPEGHTRLPRYARGRHGVVRHDWGVFVFPDTHAHGRGAHPQHCYAVEFTAGELWGDDHPANQRVRVDLWEAYLEPVHGESGKEMAKAAVKKASAPRRTASPTKLKKTAAAKMKKAPAPAKHASGRTNVKASATRARMPAKPSRK